MPCWTRRLKHRSYKNTNPLDVGGGACCGHRVGRSILAVALVIAVYCVSLYAPSHIRLSLVGAGVFNKTKVLPVVGLEDVVVGQSAVGDKPSGAALKLLPDQWRRNHGEPSLDVGWLDNVWVNEAHAEGERGGVGVVWVEDRATRFVQNSLTIFGIHEFWRAILGEYLKSSNQPEVVGRSLSDVLDFKFLENSFIIDKLWTHTRRDNPRPSIEMVGLYSQLGTGVSGVGRFFQFRILKNHLGKLAVHDGQLMVIDPAQKYPNENCCHLQGNLPRWSLVGAAIIAVAASFWGWWNFRTERKIFWGFCVFISGCVLWGHLVNLWLS
jgi:hypothetical protein